MRGAGQCIKFVAMRRRANLEQRIGAARDERIDELAYEFLIVAGDLRDALANGCVQDAGGGWLESGACR